MQVDIWSRLKTETPEQYKAFQEYVRLDSNIHALQKKIKKNIKTLKRWHLKFKWDQRAGAYTQALARNDTIITNKISPVKNVNAEKDFDLKNPMTAFFKSEVEIYLLYKRAAATILHFIEKGDMSGLQREEIEVLKLLQNQGKIMLNFLANQQIVLDNGDTNQEAKLERLSIEELEILREIHKKLAS